MGTGGGALPCSAHRRQAAMPPTLTLVCMPTESAWAYVLLAAMIV